MNQTCFHSRIPVRAVRQRMGTFAAVLSVLTLLPSTARAAAGDAALEFTGTMYEQGSNRGNVLYTVDRKHSADGLSGKSVFKDGAGNEVVTEAMTYSAPHQLIRYEVDHKQTGRYGKIEVRGDQLVFEYRENEKTKTAEEKLPENWVVGPTVVPYMIKNWSRIKAGETVKVRFAVWDRRETVGFDLAKVDKPSKPGFVTVKMDPTSFVIAALVKPLYFYMEEGARGVRLREVDGRILPKRKEGEKWKDLDAETVYVFADEVKGK